MKTSIIEWKEHDLEKILSLELTKSKNYWGPGPWQKEPDINSVGKFEYKGYKNFLMRGPMGNWCGYVTMSQSVREKIDPDELCVHGGITFEGQPGTFIKTFFDVAEGSQMIGFDCAHSGDIIPSLYHEYEKNRYKNIRRSMLKDFEDSPEIQARIEQLGELSPDSYKSVNFVVKELYSLVDQIEKVINDKTNTIGTSINLMPTNECS